MKTLVYFMKYFIFLCLLILLTQQNAGAQTTYLIITDSLSHEPLIGATVQCAQQGASTNVNGLAKLMNLPTGKQSFRAAYIGYHEKSVAFNLPAQDTFRIELLAEGENLEEIVVQSSRTNSRLEDSPTKVEVLGREDMLEENSLKPNNVASILGDYSGVQIQQTSLNSGNSGIRIQGLASRYTQILRDGLPLYTGLSGDFGILQVQPLDLQQIELIKNPASTLFGGGAIAGVVNFISKSPGQKPERSFTINQTTLSETNGTVWLSGRNEKVGYTFFAGGNRQFARDVNTDGFSDVPDLKSLNVHPRLFLYGKNKSQLALGLTLTADTRVGGDIAVIRDGKDATHVFSEKNSTRRGVFDAQWRKPMQNGRSEWQAKAAVGIFKRDKTLPDWRFSGKQEDWFSELSYRKNQTERLRWVAGVNFSGNHFEPNRQDSIAFGQINNSALGLFGQLAYQKGRWNAESGFRVDARPTWGIFPLPSGALLYHVSKSVFVRAGFGLGYAVPNPLTLASDNTESDPRKVLAPDTKTVNAERSVGGNIEWNFHRIFGDNISLSFNQQFFYTRFGNPVTTVRTASGFLRPINATAPLTTGGVDHYFRLDIFDTELYLGYTYVLAKQHWNAAQPYIPLTPRHRVTGVLAREFGKHFRTGIEASWTGKQTRSDGTKTQSYLFFAGMMGLRFGHFDFILNCENLLDFRQTRKEPVVLGTRQNPSFVPLWAPVDGRVVNFAVVYRM
jgi:hypothetical protein